jgi:hypothetical protein
MAGQVSPGIVLRERDLTTQTIVNVQANAAALVGSFAKGPVGVVTDISTERELLEIFGEPNTNNYEDWFVAQTYLSYGGRVKVVRIADTTLKNAVDNGTAPLIKSLNDYILNYSSYTTWKFAARTPGIHANGYKVSTIDGSSFSGTFSGLSSANDDEVTILTGTGTGASFNITVTQGSTTYTVAIAAGGGGSGFVVGNTIKILGTALGGASPANDLTLTVGTVNSGVITAVSVSGTAATNAAYQSKYVFGTTLWSSIVAAPADSNTMHIAVADSNDNILETFLYTSKNSTARDDQGSSIYFANIIRDKSAYVYPGSASLTAGSQTYTLANGVDSYTSSISNITAAFDAFDNAEEIEIDFVLAGGSLVTEADQVTKAQKTISLATNRKDCIAFISPHVGMLSLTSNAAKRDDIISFFDTVGTSNSYTVFDSGYKYIYDKYNDTYRYIPCCGDVAGLCVQVSAIQEDWFSPAGLNRGNLKNVVKLAYSPSSKDRDMLYLKRVNSIATFPGQGTVLFGDKTALATPSAFDRINVRRLFLSIEKRIGQLAKTVMFELNDETTRTAFYSSANSYLSEVQAKRGLIDYLVVCDTSNNTTDIIDRNEFVAEIYIKPTRAINYISVTFVATRSGVEFSEVIRSNG